MGRREDKQDKYLEEFSKRKNYDEQADYAKAEFKNKFNKNELFELMWSYRTVIKYLTNEIIHPDDREKAAELLKACEEVAVLAARERFEKDGAVKKMREELEDE